MILPPPSLLMPTFATLKLGTICMGQKVASYPWCHLNSSNQYTWMGMGSGHEKYFLLQGGSNCHWSFKWEVDHLWPCPSWATKAHCKPKYISYSRKSPEAFPPTPLQVSSYHCFISDWCLSGIIFLVLAIFVSCLWLTWIWQPFGFHTLYFGTSAWFRTFLAPLASESCISSSRGGTIRDVQHCHSSTN